MRYYLIIFMLVVALSSYALNTERCITMDNVVSVKLSSVKTAPDLTGSEPNLMISTQTYALPYSQASIQINSMHWMVYNNNGLSVGTSDAIDNSAVYISNTFTFREMNGVTVSMNNQIKEGNSYKVLESVDYNLVGYNPVSLPVSVSPAFVKSYQSLASNYDTSYLRNLPIERPKLLIISHTSLTAYIANFVKWKKAKGFDVIVKNRENIGSNAVAIRDSIRAYYTQYKCDYLLLLGDVTGSLSIPTNVYNSPDGQEQDADDNFYTMLSGEDYFPEMLVGRFSCTDFNEFLTMANKTISYEKAPYMADSSWMTRGLVVAGNYAEGTLRPVTPIQMSRWLREKMLAFGYAQVDTVFSPPSNPGTDLIKAAINRGVQFISYRGWGAADGWHYPAFHSNDLLDLVSSSKMPIVYSIVCNTGDFSNDVQCFGEKWMRMGTSSVPAGCVAFVGPSDLHTKTNLNNTISTGIYSSIYDDGERGFGASVLAGKIELYKNYPLNLASNDLVAFYFHVYNILSDPTMNMWMLVPQTIPTSVLTSGTNFAQSDSYIQIQASNLNGAIVTGTKNDIDYTYAIVHDGIAVLPINPDVTGNLKVTISKENFVPLSATLTPTQPATIGVNGNSLIGQLIFPGQSYSVTIAVKNYSAATVNGITASLTSDPSGLVVIQNPTQTINSIDASGTANLTFNFAVNGNVPAHKIIRFDLAFPNQTTQSSFELITGGAEFTILSHTGILNIGSTSTITFTIKNVGTHAVQNATANFQRLNTAATIANPNFNIGQLDIGETAEIQVPITINGACYNGRSIPLYITVTDENSYQSSCYYSVTAGNPTATDPTGPDQYGYFAYDNFDVNYSQHPSYQWVEIDSTSVQSTVTGIMDDGSFTVTLPFSFKYYGHEYSQMTICSNGWVSFVPTWMTDFNNLYIPAALGPYAMIAPYWDDLKGMKIREDELGNGIFNNMRILTNYDTINNRYIVEWDKAYSNYNIDLMSQASLEKFQLILYPNDTTDGDIVFQYHTIDNPAVSSNYSTVGIENHLQNDGLTYTFANFYPVTAPSLQSGLAVKFTTSAPDNFVANEDQTQMQLPFVLMQNYPNPFNPETRITFNNKAKADVSLEIYNMKGQKIRTLVNGNIAKGKQTVVWNGKDDNGVATGSGIYIYKMKSGNYSETRKMILIK